MRRLVDWGVLILFLPLWLPLMGLLALLIRCFLGAPIIFSQMRGGFRGRPFRLYKFRTMTMERDASGELLPDAKRLTRFGRFLRASSLDELPSLLNLMMNDITLVGPRPLMADYLPLYSQEQARRHEVRPGVTGWAQVNGRNALSWEEKFRMDVWYVDNRSFWLDLKILWLTLLAVLSRKGISQDGSATMERFTGTPR